MDNELLTVDDVSILASLSRRIVWRAIRNGLLKIHRKKRPILIAYSDVLEWQKSREPKISKNDLEHLYIDEHQSIHQIAKKTGVDAMSIHKLLVKYQIPRRSKSEALKGRSSWDKSASAYQQRRQNISKGRTGVKPKISEEFRRKKIKHMVALNTSPRSEEWRQKQMEAHRGEKSFRWKGGSDHYRGKNWQEQRRKARKRDDYTCQLCRITESDFGQELDVHHIIPFRQFPNYQEANLLDNLVCYCKPCHSIVEHRLEQQASLS